MKALTLMLASVAAAAALIITVPKEESYEKNIQILDLLCTHPDLQGHVEYDCARHVADMKKSNPDAFTNPPDTSEASKAHGALEKRYELPDEKMNQHDKYMFWVRQRWEHDMVDKDIKFLNDASKKIRKDKEKAEKAQKKKDKEERKKIKKEKKYWDKVRAKVGWPYDGDGKEGKRGGGH